MSSGNDRSIGGSRPLIIAAVIVLLTAAGAGAFWWFRAGLGDGTVPSPQPPEPAVVLRPDAPLGVSLFIPAGDSLVPAAGSIRRQPELQLEARAVVGALLADQRAAQAPVLRELRLRAFYLDAVGTAFVDLAAASEVRGSAWDELLAVYAIVNTVTQNFPEMKQVRLLFDGREAQTLAGHLDLSRAFMKRTDLVKAP